jgi:hypothetical protein
MGNCLLHLTCYVYALILDNYQKFIKNASHNINVHAQTALNIYNAVSFWTHAKRLNRIVFLKHVDQATLLISRVLALANIGCTLATRYIICIV